ncbi:Protein of unknown function [Pyronema omphalodes CBS 100304]|uniref:Uncharacterized protein n=1 Tax=Pyronema omphalodes (strain CBS 100304) TaxID=1076935 RepID=U4LKC3_PYROM|nr:Protein of unknown function [Pyronema omphalodes CBS 100304]
MPLQKCPPYLPLQFHHITTEHLQHTSNLCDYGSLLLNLFR